MFFSCFSFALCEAKCCRMEGRAGQWARVIFLSTRHMSLLQSTSLFCQASPRCFSTFFHASSLFHVMCHLFSNLSTNFYHIINIQLLKLVSTPTRIHSPLPFLFAVNLSPPPGDNVTHPVSQPPPLPLETMSPILLVNLHTSP